MAAALATSTARTLVADAACEEHSCPASALTSLVSASAPAAAATKRSYEDKRSLEAKSKYDDNLSETHIHVCKLNKSKYKHKCTYTYP